MRQTDTTHADKTYSSGDARQKHYLQNKLTVIIAVILVIPFLVSSYILFIRNEHLDHSQLFLFMLTLVLGLGGIKLIRCIFDEVYSTSESVKNAAAASEKIPIELHHEVSELQEISSSFNRVMERLEQATHSLDRRLLELSSIREITEFAGRTLDREALFRFLLDKAVIVTDAAAGSACIVDTAENSLQLIAVAGSRDFIRKCPLDVYEPMMRRVIESRITLTTHDITIKRADEATGEQPGDAFSCLCMPILKGTRVLAVLNLFHRGDTHRCNGSNEEVLSIMLNEIGFALDNAHLHAELQKKLEELEERNASLQKEQMERADLEEQLHRAEKMEAIGTMAGGIAHDLNNVLGVLVGYSELLLEDIPEDDSLKTYAANILASGQKGAAIVQDLLTLARRGLSISTVVNLNSLVSDYAGTPEFEALKTLYPNVDFVLTLTPDLISIKGSPVHLGKTIMNLVTNAAESIEGRGTVIIATQNCYLEKPLRRYDDICEGEYATLEISDTGTGIPKENLGKIFEPFYTKKVMGRSGTGLGLAVVWGTVKDHHGYIDVTSEVGAGSTFTLYFPVTREDIEEAQTPIARESYQGKGESILVVDDVPEQRELAFEVLSRLGYRVATAAGGEEAVEYLKENRADLVVLDMIMEPGIDGLETYRRILEINPHQKATIVSGFSETDRARDAQKLGAGTYVRKPYTMEKIGPAIRRDLEGPSPGDH